LWRFLFLVWESFIQFSLTVAATAIPTEDIFVNRLEGVGTEVA